MTARGFRSSGEYTPDNLFAGEFPSVQRMETIIGGKYKRGTVLGRITESGSYKICEKTDTDGSEKPAAILAEDIDAKLSEVKAVVYHAGEFNLNALIYGKSFDEDSIREAFQSSCAIFLRKNQEA